MARTLTPQDGYLVINALVKQLTGQQAVTATDLSSFISAGELIWTNPTENVFNALHIVMNRTLVASRKYEAQLKLMNAIDTGAYSSRIRKISFYADEALPSGAFNTDLYTNLSEGFTAGENPDAEGTAQSTKSQWAQHRLDPLEMNFGGSTTWQYCITLDEDATKAAFESPEAFAAFLNAYIQEHENTITSGREAWNRMCLLGKIGQVYDMSSVMPGSVVDLTAAYNAKFGTSYTGAQLRTTYLKEFLAFFVATLKEDKARLGERTARYHWTPTNGNKKILRHCSASNLHVYLYSELFTEAESLVLPEIFHEGMLEINNYQPVTYWQSNEDDTKRAQVKVTPAVVNTSTGACEAGEAVNLGYVVGLITDKDGLMTDMQVETARTTAVEARKGYRNTWLTISRNVMIDPTEQAILYVMS